MPLDDRELLITLRNIIYALKTKTFPWRLEGSANLRIQDVPMPVNDVDICTNNDGLRIFRQVLAHYQPQEKYQERIQARVLTVKINSVPVEILVYEQFELRMFEKVVPKSWGGITLPVLPLQDALTFYRLVHRLDKVELLERILGKDRA